MSVSRVGRRFAAVAASLGLAAGCTASPAARPVDPSLVNQAKLVACPTTGNAVKGGLPKLTLPCLDGTHKVNLAALRGPAIVNVWYSTCDPCLQESGYLEQFRTAAAGKVAVIGIDTEPYPNPGLQFEIKQNVHYASLSDQHDQARSKLKVVGFPTTYFVDAAGHLVGSPHGPFYSLSEVKAAVKAHLGIAVS
jgi:cytochrome c biogenesis protein CcmG, thiol:disulfide interchange protein DsbE